MITLPSSAQLGVSTNYRLHSIFGLDKKGEQSGYMWHPTQSHNVPVIMPMLLLAFLHWFAILRTDFIDYEVNCDISRLGVLEFFR